jgi:hypothetical protein
MLTSWITPGVNLIVYIREYLWRFLASEYPVVNLSPERDPKPNPTSPRVHQPAREPRFDEPVEIFSEKPHHAAVNRSNCAKYLSHFLRIQDEAATLGDFASRDLR